MYSRDRKNSVINTTTSNSGATTITTAAAPYSSERLSSPSAKLNQKS
jgi:hypothetical protein